MENVCRVRKQRQCSLKKCRRILPMQAHAIPRSSAIPDAINPALILDGHRVLRKRRIDAGYIHGRSPSRAAMGESVIGDLQFFRNSEVLFTVAEKQSADKFLLDSNSSD